MINNYDKLFINEELVNEGLILYKLKDLKVIMGGKLLGNTTNPELANYVINDYVSNSQWSSKNEEVIKYNIANRIYMVDAETDDHWKWQSIPSPQLTQVIINSRHYNWHYIASNSNPELTDFILKNISVIEENECLTEKITNFSNSDNEDDVNYFGRFGGLLTNTNPELTDFIVKNISVIEENECLTEKITKVSDSDNEDDVNYFGKPGDIKIRGFIGTMFL